MLGRSDSGIKYCEFPSFLPNRQVQTKKCCEHPSFYALFCFFRQMIAKMMDCCNIYRGFGSNRGKMMDLCSIFPLSTRLHGFRCSVCRRTDDRREGCGYSLSMLGLWILDIVRSMRPLLLHRRFPSRPGRLSQPSLRLSPSLRQKTSAELSSAPPRSSPAPASPPSRRRSAGTAPDGRTAFCRKTGSSRGSSAPTAASAARSSAASLRA